MNRKKIKALVMVLFLFGVALSVFAQSRNPLAGTRWECKSGHGWTLAIEFTENIFIYTDAMGWSNTGVYTISGGLITTKFDNGRTNGSPTVWIGRLIGDTLYYHDNSYHRVK